MAYLFTGSITFQSISNYAVSCSHYVKWNEWYKNNHSNTTAIHYFLSVLLNYILFNNALLPLFCNWCRFLSQENFTVSENIATMKGIVITCIWQPFKPYLKTIAHRKQRDFSTTKRLNFWTGNQRFETVNG